MDVFTFTRMYPELIPPMRADKAALGYMPTSAYQYCEAMRVASSHGWYTFPPADISLQFDGTDIFCETDDGGWEPLSYRHLPGHVELWDAQCPSGYEGLAPPFLRALPAPGALQVWSGWLLEATEGWSALVRPLVNAQRSNLFGVFEGVVEVDRFCPCPLFANLQLRATHVPIRISRLDPLFQVQAIRRESYAATGAQIRDGLGDQAELSPAQWLGFRRTVRADRPDETHRLGDYAAEVRKRAKAGQVPDPQAATG